jgi:hypothetical protein
MHLHAGKYRLLYSTRRTNLTALSLGLRLPDVFLKAITLRFPR